MSGRSPKDEANRARIWSVIWWVQAPIVCGGFLLLSSQPMADRLIEAYIAFASIAAMGVTYSAKSRAALAEDAAN